MPLRQGSHFRIRRLHCATALKPPWPQAGPPKRAKLRPSLTLVERVSDDEQTDDTHYADEKNDHDDAHVDALLG